MRLLGHADEKHRLQIPESDAALLGQRVFDRQNDNRLVPANAFPLQILRRRRKTQPHETQIDFARFEGSELFPRRQIEEVQRHVRETLAKSPQHPGQQPKIEMGQIGDIELARFSPAETLDGMDAFRHQSQHPLGIDEESSAFLCQGYVILGTIEKAHPELFLQITDLAGQRWLR